MPSSRSIGVRRKGVVIFVTVEQDGREVEAHPVTANDAAALAMMLNAAAAEAKQYGRVRSAV